MDIQPAEVQGQTERVDRCARGYVADIRRTFPAPCEYDGLDIQSNARSALRLIASAPWFDKSAVQADGEHLRSYTDSSSLLPGGYPVMLFKVVDQTAGILRPGQRLFLLPRPSSVEYSAGFQFGLLPRG